MSQGNFFGSHSNTDNLQVLFVLTTSATGYFNPTITLFVTEQVTWRVTGVENIIDEGLSPSFNFSIPGLKTITAYTRIGPLNLRSYSSENFDLIDVDFTYNTEMIALSLRNCASLSNDFVADIAYNAKLQSLTAFECNMYAFVANLPLLTYINVQFNHYDLNSCSGVNFILDMLDDNSSINGVVDVSNNNCTPNAAALVDIANLRAKGWTVIAD